MELFQSCVYPPLDHRFLIQYRAISITCFVFSRSFAIIFWMTFTLPNDSTTSLHGIDGFSIVTSFWKLLTRSMSSHHLSIIQICAAKFIDSVFHNQIRVHFRMRDEKVVRKRIWWLFTKKIKYRAIVWRGQCRSTGW